MTITRVWLEEGCVSCGMSEVHCPEVFKLTVGKGSEVIEGADYSSLEEKIYSTRNSLRMTLSRIEDLSWIELIDNKIIDLGWT